MAMGVPSISMRAASPSGSRELPTEQRRKQALDKPAAGFAAGAVRHLDLRVAETNRRRAIVDSRVISLRLPSLSIRSPARRSCGIRSCNMLRMSPLKKP